MMRSFLPPLVILSTASLLLAERLFDNVVFTAEKCKELGYDNQDDFEACAVMEFCTSPDRRSLRQLDQDSVASWWEEQEDSQTPGGMNESDQLFAEEVSHAAMEKQQQQQQQENPSSPDSHTHQSTSHGSNGSSSSSSSSSSRSQIGPIARYGWRVEGSDQCSWPGPVMRLNRGVKHGLFVRGSTEATNIHFHGLHIAGHGNGDDMDRSVKGEENVLIYKLDLPADQHHGGTHWYHSHLHGKSWDQVKGGAFGMIVVSDNGHDVGTDDPNVLGFLDNEKLLIFDNSHDPDFQVNGLEKEIFPFVKDEWYRLRILAVNVQSHSDQEDIGFPDACQVHAISHDGIFRFEVPSEPRNTFILTSSSRLDVAIKCSENADILINGEPKASIRVDASKPSTSVTPFESDQKSWKSARLEYTKDLRNEPVDNHWSIRVDETNINRIATGNGPLCDDDNKDFQYGTVQSWKLSGADSHPFHVHMYPMQVVSSATCGSGHDDGEYYDTIVTDGATSHRGCELRLYLIDVAGPTTMHCHIFEHAEHGALGYINVEGGPKQTGPTCMEGSKCVEAATKEKCSDSRLRRQL